MLLLLFRVDAARYALDARHVVEVLPLVRLHPAPHAPAAVSGVFNYRGRPVPAVDVSRLLSGRPAATRMSTRLVVVRRAAGSDGESLLGLIVEHAVETVRRPREDFVPTGVASGAAPYLGPVAPDAGGVIQLVDSEALLPEPLRDVLTADPSES